MPRHPVERVVVGLPPAFVYKPAGTPAHRLETIHLAIDELEAMRLVDHQGMSQEAAASLMGISRQTVGRIMESARKKVADALLSGKALEIGGGPYRVAPADLLCLACDSRWPAAATYPQILCPACGSPEVRLPPGPGVRGRSGRGRSGANGLRGPGMGWGRGRRSGGGSSVQCAQADRRPADGPPQSALPPGH